MPGLLRKMLMMRVIIALFLFWMLVCPAAGLVDAWLTAAKVERWMVEQGITEEDIVDVEGLREAVAMSSDPAFINPSDYIVDIELAQEAARVARSPYDWPFLRNYWRWGYQKLTSNIFTGVVLSMLIAKELEQTV